MSHKTIYYILLSAAICRQGVRVESYQHGRRHMSSRISNGSSAEIEQFSYMAYLEIEGSETRQCGGTILDAYNIVTAASCVDGAKIIRVRIGSTYRSSGGYEYIADSSSKHPRYDNNTGDFNIGMVIVDEGMELDGETTAPMGVVTISNDPQVGEYMTISGWGATDETGEGSEELQRGKVPVIDREICRSSIPSVTTRMFCARRNGTGSATNICEGDYGGPAIGEANLLDGISAFRDNTCGSEDSTGVFTRVGHPLIRAYIRLLTGI